MQPSPAEIARTLATGRLAGTVQVAYHPWRYPVRHAIDRAGQVLLLSRAGGEVAAALEPRDGSDDVAVVLTVPDVPPVDGAPSLGQLDAAGWARVLTGTAAREAALEFAVANPDNDLLGVGQDFVLHRVAVAEVRLERSGRVVPVGLDEYAQAEPDPLHAEERDLLVDLAEHHMPQIGEFLRQQLTRAGHRPGADLPRVVRMDRYGLTVAVGEAYRVRLAFPRAVRDRPDLARMLHPALCLQCGRGGYSPGPMSPAM
jgi:hypothetical protein